MATKSPSASNDSDPEYWWDAADYCFLTKPSSFIFTAFTVVNSLTLPLFILTLHRALRKRRMNHSDAFTYHTVLTNLVGGFGYVLTCVGIHSKGWKVFIVGRYMSYFAWYGETSFHVLSCLERYLAVVHPVTYRNLRTGRGVRIRNASIGCVHLLSIALLGFQSFDEVNIVDMFFVLFTFIVLLLCSISVLCVLIRPGPGERGGNRDRVDQSKRRAFYTIVALLGVMVLRFIGDLLWESGEFVGAQQIDCVSMTCMYWSTIPGTLVLPLLFLHRASKSTPRKENTSDP